VRIATFLPSLDRLSILLAKVTEVGADEIFLLIDRQDRRGGAPAGSLERWRRTVTEAASQSKRAYVPMVHQPMPFETFLDAHREDAVLCDPAGDVVVGEARSIALIGPEAGLDPEEIGLPTARLPGNILRIETAAIVAAALLVVERERIVVRGQK
jgi:16S rRNA (uracil1498-N3)-methyltransferase